MFKFCIFFFYFIFIFLFIIIYTCTFLIKIVYFLHISKSIRFGLRYKYIYIEEKHFCENTPIFLLLCELLKILIFSQLYLFFKKYKNYNIYILILFGFFFSLFKVLHDVLFIFLDYPFNKKLNTYLIIFIKKLMIYFKDFKIEFMDGFLSFNAGSSKTLLTFLESINKKYGIFSLFNNVKNASSEMKQINEIINFHSKEIIDNVVPNKLFKPVYAHLIYKNNYLSSIPHITVINENLTSCSHITSHVYNEYIPKYGAEISSVILPKNKIQSKIAGLVGNRITPELQVNILYPYTNIYQCYIYMHCNAWQFSSEFIETMNCWDKDLIKTLQCSHEIIVDKISKLSFLKENITKEDINQAVKISFSFDMVERSTTMNLPTTFINEFQNIKNKSLKNENNTE